MTQLDNSDRRISDITEAAARRLTRRQSLFRVLKGTVAGAAALSVANLEKVSSAFAISCTCGPSASCQSHGYSCPTGGNCATGYGTCTSGNCYPDCIWSTAQWVSCTHCAQGLNSYRVCSDCKLGNYCSPHCTCLSDCLCTGCDSPGAMAADMVRRGILVSA